MNDTGMNLPESLATLQKQQEQLIAGRRLAQMFPLFTRELELPSGFDRVITERGVFHFNPELVTKNEVFNLSNARRENLLLGFGPYNKQDVVERGEPLLAVTERTPDGIEVKSVIGTLSTAREQFFYLEQNKTPGNIVAIEDTDTVLFERFKESDYVAI
jgi:hypothetical protein